MTLFKCKMCGGTLEINGNESVGTCDSCGTQQTLPRLDGDRRANLYDRANHFRRSNEFDKAMALYERILEEDTSDAEAYWSLVLCRYGIEYVEDPGTRKWILTVNRAQYTSIFDDENYKLALQYADGYQRHIYEEEAGVINEIQKGFLAISQKEEPFDVFICYKETDRNGRRTPDSVLANDLYHQLTQEGFKVFFSRITLEDKLGVAYEPYIFAALNSAKVMVVLGTRPEYFNAVWVRNEWSRYLALIKNGAKKILIPAYRDMDPYDLPEEFSHLQAQDMGKLGFMQDLIRGIKKIAKTEEPKATVVKETVIAGAAANTAPLLKRAFMFLEDMNWDSADEYCEKVLDIDPENAKAYLGKLMAELNVCKQEDLRDQEEAFDEYNNYLKAIRFADAALKEELKGYIDYINDRNEKARLENAYNYSKRLMTNASTEDAYKKAARSFETIPDYKDSAALAEECYLKAEEARKEAILKAEEARKDAILAAGKARMEDYTISSFQEAFGLFRSISGWKDADEKCQECQERIAELKAAEEAARLERERKAEADRLERERLAKIRAKRNKTITIVASAAACVAVAIFLLVKLVIIPNNAYKDTVALMDAGNYVEAMVAFEAMDGYKDSAELIQACKQEKYNEAEALLTEDKKAEAAIAFGWAIGYQDAWDRSNALWSEIAKRDTVSISGTHIVALRNDGTALATGPNEYGECNVADWSDLVAVCTGENAHHTVGLRSDGTVVAVGSNSYEKCNVTDWTNIVAIYADNGSTYGLRANGTVVTTGSHDVGNWTNIVSVITSGEHTIGLRADGTVVATGNNDFGECNVETWTEIVSVTVDHNVTYGVRADGTVVAAGRNKMSKDEADSGTVIAVICDSIGDFAYGVHSDSNVVAMANSYHHIVKLYADGTVDAHDRHDKNEASCKVESWKDIVAIWADTHITYGLRSDGTMVVADGADGGTMYTGRSNVRGWTDIKLPGDNLAESRDDLNSERYIQAEALLAEGKTAEAAIAFGKIPLYEDARERSLALWNQIAHRETISAGDYHTVGLRNDGTVVAVGNAQNGECDVSGWTDIVAVSADGYCTIGLCSDGAVVATGSNDDGACNVNDWHDIVAISTCAGQTVGLRIDGTVVATGYNKEGACNVSDWADVVAVSAGADHTVGLRSDGTVVAVGDNEHGQCDVSNWKNIVAVGADAGYTVGLCSNGTVVAVGVNYNVTDWTDIVAIGEGWGHIVGLRSNGTVVAVGDNWKGQCDVENWTDIVAISAGSYYTLGLRSDGTVVAAGKYWDFVGDGSIDVSGWKNIKLPD